jgi:acetolactate synthase-1/2/3 large subunit
MHLLESCSRRFKCIPVVHEVAAGVAAEYFTLISNHGKAFALVTAGPGLTNIVSAIAGAFLESHELLVLGGQVKVENLAREEVRQRGIQEVNGVEIVRPITVGACRLEAEVGRSAIANLLNAGATDRKGPVFIEIPLDIQGRVTEHPGKECKGSSRIETVPEADPAQIEQMISRIRRAHRPVILIGGGITYETSSRLLDQLACLGIPIMTTWNGADRIPAEHPMYFGRPNTWGQRSSNILLQQSDLLIALGTRLGLQQTGFNWQEFVPLGEIAQVECDPAELDKGHPRVDLRICGDANAVLSRIAATTPGNYEEWYRFCKEVRELVPTVEAVNSTRESYISPYVFVKMLSDLCDAEDVIVPCSSGGAYTVMMQVFECKRGQRLLNNKGLAAMGYGLGGAIGAAFAAGGRRTILVEGDGGFVQNMQELGTVMSNALNIKVFLFANDGYASIRMTQKNYFGGKYVGCDRRTGLGLPNWGQLFSAYEIPVMEIGPGFEKDEGFLHCFESAGPAAFIVKIDPEQTYYPKIASRITETGGMVSNPLHLMTPELPEEVASKVMRYLTR